MPIGNLIGQAGFVSAPAVRVEDSPMWQHARPRHTGERVVHATPPMTDAERQRQADFSSHGAARAGAARRGQPRAISTEELNAKRLAAAESADFPNRATTDALQARVSSQEATLATQAAMIQELRDRLDAVEGGGTSGEAA
jgi:hypothetical protein